MKLVVILGLLMPLASCGVYQAAKHQDSTQGYSAMMLLSPRHAVMGSKKLDSKKEKTDEKVEQGR